MHSGEGMESSMSSDLAEEGVGGGSSCVSSVLGW